MPSLSFLESAFLHCGVHPFLFMLPLRSLFLSAYLNSFPPHDLVLCSVGSVPFPLGKGGSGVLANCFLCGTQATLSFSTGPACSSFSAEACAILHASCWSRQHQQVCHLSFLLLSDSRFVLATLSSPPSFLLPQTLTETVISPPVLSGCSGSPDTRFSRVTMRLMNWPGGERYLGPLQFLVVSRIHFCRTGGVLSHVNFTTCRFLDFHRGTCAPSSCSLCSLLSTLQRTQPSSKFLSL